MFPHFHGVVSSVDVFVPITSTYLGEAASASDLTEYPFNTKSIGAASANKRIVMAIQRDGGSARTVASVTVHIPDYATDPTGTALAKAHAVAGIGANAVSEEIWWGAIPGGPTADFRVTFSGGAVRCGIKWGSLDGPAAMSVADTGGAATGGASSLNDTINVAKGGAVWAGSGNNNNATTTWTNLTKHGTDLVTEGTSKASGADDEFAAAATGLSITATFSASSEGTFAMASFGPA